MVVGPMLGAGVGRVLAGSNSIPQWLHTILVEEMPNRCGVWRRRSMQRIHFMQFRLSYGHADSLTAARVRALALAGASSVRAYLAPQQE